MGFRREKDGETLPEAIEPRAGRPAQRIAFMLHPASLPSGAAPLKFGGHHPRPALAVMSSPRLIPASQIAPVAFTGRCELPSLHPPQVSSYAH